MSKILSVFKSLLVVVLIAAGVLVLYMGSSRVALAPNPGKLINLLVAPDEYLDDYISFPIDGDQYITGGYDALDTDIEKAVFLWEIASFNENDIPYFAFFTNGGGASSFESLGGRLETNSYHVTNYDLGFRYHRWINALTDVIAPSGTREVLQPAIEILLAKGDESIYYEGKSYVRYAVSGQTTYSKDLDQNLANWKSFNIGDSKLEMGVIAEDEYKFEEIGVGGSYRYTSKNYMKYSSSSTLNDNDVVKSATITEEIDQASGRKYYKCKIITDVAKANENTMIIDLLNSQNKPASGLKFIKYEADFEVWDNGLFRQYTTTESWNGELAAAGMKLKADTQNAVYTKYSYSLSDCQPTDYMEVVKNLK